jgi:hypothetical protein
MERLKPAAAERSFIILLRDLLADQRWEVEDEAIVGTVRPDLLLRDPQGHVFVAEINFGEGASHFGSVAQAASNASSASSFLHSAVKAFLVTDQELPSGVSEAAEKLGVAVVGGSPEPESGGLNGLVLAFYRNLLGEDEEIGVEGEEGVGSSST